MKYYNRSKRPFMLLEVMIALALVALCAIPLIKPSLSMHAEQQRMTQQMELERFVSMEYVKVLEKLYKGEIKWEDIAAGYTRPLTLPESCDFEGKWSLTLDPDHTKPLKCLLFWECELNLKSKRDQGRSKIFKYLIFVKRPAQTDSTTPNGKN